MAETLKDYHGPEYVRSEAMIPMRDGVTLHTVILRPVGSEKDGSGAAVSDDADAVWGGGVSMRMG